MSTDNINDPIIESTQTRIEQINHPEMVANQARNRDVVVGTDHARHGLDDDPNNDAEKGAALGGLGGAAVGAAAGSIAGPVGTLVGAIAGGLVGAGASGAAVAAVDSVDNDNTISGIGDGVTLDSDGRRVDAGYAQRTGVVLDADAHGHNIVTGGEARTEAGDTGLAGGAVVGGLVGAAVGGPVGAVVGGTLGSLAGGVAGDAAEAGDEEDLTRPSVYNSATETNVAVNPVAYNPGSTLTGTSISPPVISPMNDSVTVGDNSIGEGHNIVTGGPATTEAGDDGLVGGAVVGGVIGAAVGGPVGAVVGGTLGSLTGGVAGDAAEAAADDEVRRTDVR